MNQMYGYCVLFVAVSTALGCTIDLPWYARSMDKTKNEVDDQKIHFSQVVVFGQAKGEATGNYPMSSYDGLYTIEFEVLCSYKGGVVPNTIYIAGVGNLNDAVPECPRVEVQYSKDYFQVMFLKRTNKANVFEIEYKPNESHMEEVDIVLDDLTMNCGLDLVDGADAMCVDFIPLTEEEECEKYKPPKPTTPKPTTPKPTTPKPIVVETETKDTVDVELPTRSPGDKTDVDVDIESNAEDDNSNNQSDQGYNTKTTKPGAKTGQTIDDDDKGAATGMAASVLLTTLVMSIAALL